jgi:hypothetical protein
MTPIKPNIGSWYANTDSGQIFEVVEVDDDVETIAIQYADGNIEEMELRAWNLLNLEDVAEPEEWTGALDENFMEDFDEGDFSEGTADWSAALGEVDEYDL